MKQIGKAVRLRACFKLTWHEIGGSVYPYYRSGKTMTLELKQPSLADKPIIKVFGAAMFSPKIEVDSSDKDWRKQLEDGVFTILTAPNACDWTEYVSPAARQKLRANG